MKTKLLSLLIALALCAPCVVTITMAAGDIPDTLEPIIIPVTAPPTETPTIEPTLKPTTEPVTTIKTLLPTIKPTETVTIEPTVVGGGKGWIDTYGNVDGALVYFDGKPEGAIVGGILSVAVAVSGTPVRTISVSKSGYSRWSGSLPHMPADGEHVAVYATINPISTPTPIPPIQNGAIYAHSLPNGAAIYMNGQFYGNSPVTIPNIPAGTYSMKATLNGYTPDTRMIMVYAGQTAFYSPTLQQSPQPPRNTGTVYTTSNPDHASVYVDGNYNGKTPMTLTLYPGSHSFVLKLSGYSDYSTNMWVNAGQAQNLPVPMTPAIYGSVLITSLPGANVYMDSALLGNVGPGGSYTIASVTSGNHLFKVTASGYNEWMSTVYIQPNYQTTITATLTPIGINPTPVPATGGIDIASAPSGAETYVDNLYRGYTPATLTGITPGEHAVLLKYTGYIDYSTTTTVNAGQTIPLAITMTAAPVPTPKSALSPLVLIGGLVAIFGIGAALRRRT
ncbi:MAG: PEGA domain-containing protein [Methanoregula sp.]|jgi:hypothetical protein